MYKARLRWGVVLYGLVFGGLAAQTWVRHGPGPGLLDIAFCLAAAAGRVNLSDRWNRFRENPFTSALSLMSLMGAGLLPVYLARPGAHSLLWFFSQIAGCGLALGAAYWVLNRIFDRRFRAVEAAVQGNPVDGGSGLSQRPESGGLSADG